MARSLCRRDVVKVGAAHLVPESGGFFKKEGVEVELITGRPTAAKLAELGVDATAIRR